MADLTPLPPQVQRKSLGDQVYDSIRESIVSLRLAPGSMIYENVLAETLQVSRTPIREAIRLLVNEQLLEVMPQRGTRIALISERKVGEARFIREHLELGAFRLAARLWNEPAHQHQAVAEQIERLMQEQRLAAEQGDVALFLQLDESFHQAIIHVTSNETLLQVICHMRGHLNRVRFLAMKELRQMDRVMEEHQALFAAIRQGNEALTAELLQQHVGKLDHELPELRELYPNYFTV
ncbi:GntR family transcriptional regulator [Paenibacillus sp. GCM10027626]|uniref:GntR family transcriptional regulator n=1 Tax=Paenibacillus sp. GCM10027626 TaxID=3273411 RepID=UPI00362857EA